ncbi:MAG: hypothetical protein A4E35_01030 [Methanoregula sp. PtaU1.Bin051]|nr:MAG: hypothetical protein A4E35_01030 [Methanoregula sp. PtaU1.Bin051]
MTRGRPPLVALKEAQIIAMKRGQVLPVSEGRCDHFHFILFTEDRVIFIKVKRMLTDVSDPAEILYNYERDIKHIIRVPLNSVDARELWVRSPRGAFHFFLIGKDRIFGLQADGSVMSGTEYPLEFPKPKDTPAVSAGKIPAADPAKELPAEKIPAEFTKEIPVEKDSAPAQTPVLLRAGRDPVPEQIQGKG